MTANAKSKTYGDGEPGARCGGDRRRQRRHPRLQPGDDGGATSGVGSYPIAVTLGTNPNYTVTPTDAALTVNPAAATVTANAKSKTYGDGEPGARRGGDRRRQRRHPQLQPGDDGG